MTTLKGIAPVLYIFMRTDMESLNPGKAMAQAAHAANQMAIHVRAITEKAHKTDGGGFVKHCLNEWEQQGVGFGKTIVFNGDTLEYVKDLIETMEAEQGLKPWRHGTVLDETYPITDGRMTHLLPIETCVWWFGDISDETLKAYFSGFTLHD